MSTAAEKITPGDRAAQLISTQWPRGSADFASLNSAAYKLGLLVNGSFLTHGTAEGMLDAQIKARAFPNPEEAKSVSLTAFHNGYGTNMARDAIIKELMPANDNVSRFTFETFEDLLSLPPTKWLVRDWIPENTIGILYGKWGSGKTFLAFDLSLHLVYVMNDWHGVELPEYGANVLYIAREGHRGFVNRVEAFKKHHGILDQPERITFMRGVINFMSDADFAAFCRDVSAQGTAFNLVVVDTVGRSLPGADMNEQATVTTFMERCARLGELTGATVLAVHHENKSGGMMGSAYFESNSDFLYHVSKGGSEDGPLQSGTVRCDKLKDGEDGWTRIVRYRKIAGLSEDDPTQSSLIVESVKAPTSAETLSSAAGKGYPPLTLHKSMLDHIREAWDSGKPLHSHPNTKVQGRYAPAILAAKFDCKEHEAKKLVEYWLAKGTIELAHFNAHENLKGLKVLVDGNLAGMEAPSA